MASVQILLSTWNGEPWLAELLDSLLKQGFNDWQLVCRDDGSQDKTAKILLDWQQTYPEKVAYCEVGGRHLGVAGSFSRLVEHSDAPYLMFCDQDDVWFPEKIALEMAAMQEQVAIHGDETPLLVHSDLEVVNSHKNVMSASFWEMRKLDVGQSRNDYLLTNTVTGCATLFNRCAAERAFPLPEGVQYHDRWLALVCSWFGRVYPLPLPLLFYRQHGGNALGAGHPNYGHVSSVSVPERINAWSRQAEIFLQRFGAELSAQDYRLVEALAELRHLHGWVRRRHIVQYRLFKPGILANLALLWFAG